MQIFDVASADEAVALARSFAEDGYDLFRGQNHAWPPRASYWRAPEAERARFERRMDALASWLDEQPGVAESLQSMAAKIAVAQHHGLETVLLDVTRDPAVAAYFALDGGPQAEAPAALFCWRSEAIAEADGLTLLEIDVSNLWRLEAQKGAFLITKENAEPEAVPDMRLILFAHSDGAEARTSLPPRDRVYPERASVLETALVEGMNVLRQRENYGHFSKAEEQGVAEHVLSLAYWGPPPSAFAKRAPPTCEGWETADAEAWGRGVAERFEDLRELPVDAPGLTRFTPTPDRLYAKLKSYLTHVGASALGPGAARPSWRIAWLDDAPVRARLEQALNEISDRLRLAPIDPPLWAKAHALVIAVAAQAKGDPDALEGAIEGLLGPSLAVEVMTDGRSRHFGHVGLASLDRAFSRRFRAALQPYYARVAAGDPARLLSVAVTPQTAFSLRAFTDLLLGEIGPLIAANEAYASLRSGDDAYGGLPALNPLAVKALTRRGDFFKPPHMYDPEAADAIVIQGDMTEAEAVAAAQSALAADGGGELFVRLMDFDDEDRAVWDDPAARGLARILVGAGATRAMQLTTYLVLPDRPPPNPRHDAMGVGGWGAIELTALAEGLAGELFSGDPERASSAAQRSLALLTALADARR